jgi:hypothetical protein
VANFAVDVFLKKEFEVKSTGVIFDYIIDLENIVSVAFFRIIVEKFIKQCINFI